MTTDNNQQKEYKARMLECALPVGTVLRGKSGREYKITGVLGAGGFGITYKAVGRVLINKATNYSQMATFAIKEFFMKGCSRGADGAGVLCSASLRGDMEAGRDDFKKEADVLVKLNGESPHIVMVNEQFEANGTCYYVMDYLEGQSLQQYMDRSARHGLPKQEALALLLPIARAVELLHAHSLLHLDIKPDNIMLHTNPVDGTVTPVLIDFGLAKHFDKHGKPTSHLMARGATEGYAPLEQSGQITTFSPQIDVYALGATLFCMLTGKTPVSALAIFHESISSYLQKNLPESISPQVRQLIADAMQPSMNDRMQTVSEFVKALEQAAGKPKEGGETSGSSMSGGGTVTFGREKKRFRFKKKHVVIGAACLLACVLALCGRAYYVMVNSTEWKAEHGDAKAQYDLAGRYDLVGDKEKALYWYTQAAEQGHANAQYNLGVYYECGNGVSQDYEKAVHWYTKAAEQGHAVAQNNLGVYYECGNGVSQDYEKAVHWYTKAAEQGEAVAQYNLGLCYENGRGVSQDYEKAVHWFTKAAEQGYADAQGALGECYNFGWGVRQDHGQAVYLYREAARKGSSGAQSRLGECYELGIGGISQNDSIAAYWYKRAAEGGNAEAQYAIGIYYKHGRGVTKNDSLAVAWLKKAAEQGQTDAKRALNNYDISRQKPSY